MKIEDIAKKAKIDISNYDMNQLKMGYKIELEHYKDPETRVVSKPEDILKIAIAHLKELPDYYTRLIKMEKEGKSKVKKDDKKVETPIEKEDDTVSEIRNLIRTEIKNLNK